MPIIVIRIGQSNSFGKAAMADLQAEYQTTFPNIKTWTGSEFASLDYSANNNQYPNPNTCFGSEFAILKGLQEHYNETIYDIKYAVGGTALGTAVDASNNWNVNTNGSYFDLAVDTINKAVAYLWNTLSVRGLYKVFIFIDQGEADSQNETNKTNYESNLTDLSTQLLSMFGTCCPSIYWINPEINQNIFHINATTRAVSGATNATPIVITTAAAHGLVTNQYVNIANVGGNTAANGNWKITVTSTTQFSLNTSVGNGVYTSGGNINSYYWKSDIQAAQQAVASSITGGYSYSCDAYSLQSDGLHYSATGFKDKGDYAVNNIIIANNL